MSELPVRAQLPETSTPIDPAAEFRRALALRTPRLRWTPLLVSINIAIFGYMVLRGVHFLSPDGNTLIAWGAQYGPRLSGGEWWRLGTCLFLHVGIVHVLLNMLALWDIGRLMERLLGHADFLVVYMLAGLLGSVFSAAWSPHAVSAGASGAIFGLYGALAGFLARDRGGIPRGVLAGLLKGVIAVVGYNLVYSLSRSHVDVAAHLGGLASGFACGLLMAQSPAGEVKARRIRRLIVAVVGGGAISAVGLWVVPRVSDLEVEIAKFDQAEVQVLGRFNDALGLSEKDLLSDEHFARIVEEDVLPEWHHAREPLAKMRRLPKEEREFVGRLLR